jgi:hypothetical protein
VFNFFSRISFRETGRRCEGIVGTLALLLCRLACSGANRLAHAGFVELVSAPAPLPFYLSEPVSQQDPKKAKAAMLKDGFLRR